MQASLSDLRRIYPRARPIWLETMTDNRDVLERAGISNNVTRLGFFLAQLGHESAGLTVFEENLNYSAAQLRRMWPNRFPDAASANAVARNPQAIANLVYGGRMGNVDEGDGWKYRGRGPIQLTGRDNYREASAAIGVDLEKNPDRATDPFVGLQIAVHFWTKIRGNRFADRDDFTGLTRAINGGVNGLADRRDWLKKVYRVISDEPVAPGSLRRSRTMQGSVAAGAGGAAMLAGEVMEVSAQAENLQDALSTGSIIMIVIGVVVIAGALYALYARWDDAGRPLPWKNEAVE